MLKKCSGLRKLMLSRRVQTISFMILLAILPALLLLPGCGRQSPDLKTEYQAVFLTNGQAFM